MLVLSRTYRLSSEPHDSGMASDPGARLRWRMTPRRLEAEAIRDTVLMASQQLETGSPGPSDAARQGFHQVGALPVSYDVPHRSVYLSVLREAVPHQLEVFDFPDPAFVRGTRTTNNTPTQALYMMNSDFITRASRETAQHLSKKEEVPAARAVLAIRTILGRPAKPGEAEDALRYVEETIAAGTKPEIAWARLCQALFASTEFRYVW